MSNSSNPPPEPSHKPEQHSVFLGRRKRDWAIAAGVTLATAGVVGYTGLRFFVERMLPQIIEKQLSQIITRPVDIGEVESFSLSGVRFGVSSIPSTDAEPSHAKIESIEVEVNLLPLITKRTLFLDLTLVKPNIYLVEDETGDWLNLNLELEEEVQERPFDLDMNIFVEEGEGIGLPYGEENPITVFFNGSGNYVQVGKKQGVSYNLDAKVADGTVRVVGATQLETKETKAQAKIQNVDLPQLAPLIPVNVELNSGELNADLALDIPSFDELTDSVVKGTLSVQNVAGQTEQLADPVAADLELRFLGEEVRFEEARLQLGDLVAQAQGLVNWQKQNGLNLDVNVSPFDVANLLKTLQFKSPVEVDGTLQLAIELEGSAEDPLLSGTLSSASRVQIDKLLFERLNTKFSANLSQFVLNSFQAIPASGGQISGRGSIVTGLKEALEEGEEIDFTQMPLSLNVDARLPTEAIAAPYYRFPNQVSVGTLTAAGQVQGTIENPKAVLKWQAPQASAPSVENISGAGEVVLVNNQLLLRGTQLQTDRGGQINLSGSGNLETETWQASLIASSVSLSPFLAQLQREPLQFPTVNLQTANVKLSGTFKTLEDLNTVEGVADVALDVGNGSVAVNSRISDGTLVASANANQIPVDQFLTTITQPVTLTSAQANVSGPLEELFALGDNPNLNAFDATFNARLAAAQGTATATGRVNNGTIVASANANQIPLSQFIPNLSQPVTLNSAQVNATGPLEELLALGDNPNLNAFDATFDARLAAAQGTATATGQVNNGTVVASANANQIPLSQFIPNLSQPVTLNSAQANVTGPLEELLALGDNPNLNAFDATFDARLAAAQGTATATGQVNNGTVVASANANQIPLSQFIPNLSQPVTLNSAQANVTGPLEELLALGDNPNLNAFDATFDARLAAAQGTATATGQVNNGTVVASANANQIPLSQIIANLSVPTTLVESRVNVSAPLEQLLALRDNPDLNRFDASLDAKLAVAQGIVNATGQLANNQWQTNVVASNLNTSLLNEQFALVDPKLNLPDLNARLNLTGNLDSFYNSGVDTTVQANTVAVQLGEQFLEANGNILLSNLTTNPDVTRLDLEVAARSNLETLPLTQLIAQIPSQQFLPQEIDATGQANFSGRLQGKNLLSAPTAPGNLALNGNLRLLDFGLNGREFDPVLAGPVTVEPGQELALNLRGQQDAIAAALEPCTRGEQCLVPYLPTSFELRQGSGTAEPIIATGRRVGDRLVARVQDFPLGILNLSPAAPYGIPGEVGGALTTNLDVNLFTLASSGAVEVTNPALGNQEGEEITARFSYRDNVAQLVSASADLGRSLYEGSGRLNFNTGEIDASLDADGYVQDILTALNITSIDSATRFFQSRDYAAVTQVEPQSVGNPEASLAAQLNLLERIEQMLKQIAQERQAPGIPTQLDIRGPFQAEVLVAGTLQNPALDFQVEGDDWNWRTQPSYPDIVDTLGFVIEDPQVFSISQVLVDGSYRDGVATLNPLQVQAEGALLAFSGQLSADATQASQGRFRVENLSVDLLRNFVDIPLDIAGDINTEGSLTGTLQNPQVEGDIAFVEGVLNGRPLNEPIAGDYQFADARLQFNTTEDSLVAVRANIPYPPEAENDRFAVDVDLDTEAIALIGAFTQGNIEWVEGQGQATVQARGRLDLSQGFSLTDLTATGQANLEDATFALNLGVLEQEPLTLNGQVALLNQRLQVETLEGTLAGSDLVASGVLPIFRPLAVANPLTVGIEGDKLDLENLYKGGIDGNVVVTGAAFTPVIGGEVRLYDGRAFVPKREARTEEDADLAALVAANSGGGTATGTIGGSGFVPILNDFEVTLGDDFKIQQRPFYQFNLEGNLTLNGPATILPQIRPNGTIYLRRGEISLFNNPSLENLNLQNLTSLQSDRFNLVRGRDNVAVFEPNQGLLNPSLDIQFVNVVTEPDQTLIVRDSASNEIPDPLVLGNNANTISILLSVNGQASEIIPALGKNTAQACQALQQPFPIPKEDGYTEAELNQLETCLGTAAIEGGSNLQVLASPAVELTSTPPRSQGAIIALLSNQFLGLAEQLQNTNEEALLQSIATQFIVAPLLRDVLFGVQSTVSGFGRNLGLADLRVLPPAVEGVYELNQQSSVTFTLDYTENEVQVRYQRRF